MKTKIVFGSILAVSLLLLLPSIPTAECNIAVELNNVEKTREELIVNIRDLRQQLSSNYIDLEIILIIILNVFAILIKETPPTILSIISLMVLSLVVIYEFTTGEEIFKCPKVPGGVIMGFFNIITALEERLIKNKILEMAIVFITIMIAWMIVLTTIY